MRSKSNTTPEQPNGLPTPYYDRDGITIYHGRWEDILPSLTPDCADAVITDPPYGFDFDRQRTDQIVDVEGFTAEAGRVASQFYAFFGQLPYLTRWLNAADSVGLHFCEHVSWVKRHCTQSHRLKRGHESICVYATGDRKQFYETTGPYEDVKVPGVMFDTVSIEGIQRQIGFLRQKIRGTLPDTYKANVRNRSLATVNHSLDYEVRRTVVDPVNFTNVWSFLTPTQAKRDLTYQHPTEKPLAVMDRLVRMLTPSDGMVIDPFAGSGTLLVAAKHMNRRAIGIEIEERYCEIAVQRLSQMVLPLGGVA